MISAICCKRRPESILGDLRLYRHNHAQRGGTMNSQWRWYGVAQNWSSNFEREGKVENRRDGVVPDR